MTITLPVTKRDDATTTEALRANGQVPAVVYGPKQEPVQVVIDAIIFDKVRKEAGDSTIISLSGLEEEVEVLIKDIDFNPVKQQVLHTDFYAFERGKEMTTVVQIHFEGEAPAEEKRIGSVTKVLHEIEVTCRPSNLPSEIVVDVSGMTEVTSKILVSDLPALEGVTYNAEPEDAVAVVSAAKQESEDEAEAAEIDMDAIEVEEKGKGDAAEEAAE